MKKQKSKAVNVESPLDIEETVYKCELTAQSLIFGKETYQLQEVYGVRHKTEADEAGNSPDDKSKKEKEREAESQKQS